MPFNQHSASSMLEWAAQGKATVTYDDEPMHTVATFTFDPHAEVGRRVRYAEDVKPEERDA